MHSFTDITLVTSNLFTAGLSIYFIMTDFNLLKRISSITLTSIRSILDDNDNEIHPSPDPAFIFQANPANQALQANPANLALQANQANPVPASAKVRGYTLNTIQRFMGPETTRGYITGQTFAMLNQNIPSLGRMMFDFLYPGKPITQGKIPPYEFKFLYPGGEPRITQSTILPYINNLEVYREMMFSLFKKHVRHSYLINKIKPIPLTPHEEQMYKHKLDMMIFYFSVGLPNRKETLLYLEDTTGNVPEPTYDSTSEHMSFFD